MRTAQRPIESNCHHAVAGGCQLFNELLTYLWHDVPHHNNHAVAGGCQLLNELHQSALCDVISAVAEFNHAAS
jgi:hypothetical protein